MIFIKFKTSTHLMIMNISQESSSPIIRVMFDDCCTANSCDAFYIRLKAPLWLVILYMIVSVSCLCLAIIMIIEKKLIKIEAVMSRILYLFQLSEYPLTCIMSSSARFNGFKFLRLTTPIISLTIRKVMSAC